MRRGPTRTISLTFARRDQSSGQTYYVNQATGETQWDAPTGGAAAPGPPAPGVGGGHGRTASVAAPRSKRVYAANQADAYASSASAAPSFGGVAPDQQPYGQPGAGGQPSQFFSPGLPADQQQQQGQYFGAPGQQQQPSYGQPMPQQPAYGQPQYGQAPNVNGMAQQFGQMNMAARVRRGGRWSPSDRRSNRSCRRSTSCTCR